MGNAVGSLTQVEKSIIIGSLLGDGYLRIVPGRKNAFLEINHSISQKEYVDWKFRKLRNIVKSPQHPELTELYLRFYSNKVKIIPDLELNPLIIAVWFMDDGSKSYKTYYLNTQSFDYLSQKRFVQILKKQYDINSSLNRDKQYYRIRIKQDSAKRFKKLIYNHIISSMKYKLNEL